MNCLTGWNNFILSTRPETSSICGYFEVLSRSFNLTCVACKITPRVISCPHSLSLAQTCNSNITTPRGKAQKLHNKTRCNSHIKCNKNAIIYDSQWPFLVRGGPFLLQVASVLSWGSSSTAGQRERKSLRWLRLRLYCHVDDGRVIWRKNFMI